MSLSPTGLVESISRLVHERRPLAIATVVRIEGSSLGKPGFKMVIDDAGEIVFGTLGGVCPEGPIISIAREVMKTGTPRLVRVYLESVESSLRGMVKSTSQDEIFVETFCGGVMEIFVEPMLPSKRLVLIAQGGKDDVEEALIKFGKILGFEVWVIDPLPALQTQPDKLISDISYNLRDLNLTKQDFVVVLTKGAMDLKVLEALSDTRPGFIGLLASKKRVEHDFAMLREKGISEEFLRSISAPVGADIGAYTPEEIALSIMAEIVAVIRGRTVPRKGQVISSITEIRQEDVSQEVTELGASCDPSTQLQSKKADI
ncbi:MAG: XdhC family protein [Aigarchaeota archaeon]|nr:XdhC family protein [Aigarchaeota archaeon]MDW8093323.1 XdhC family protein [Nitrososphaerota archaeon]